MPSQTAGNIGHLLICSNQHRLRYFLYARWHAQGCVPENMRVATVSTPVYFLKKTLNLHLNRYHTMFVVLPIIVVPQQHLHHHLRTVD